MSETTRRIVVLALLLVGSLQAGCSLIGAVAAHRHEVTKDRRTRADVASLRQVEPGALVTIKQSDTLAVTGRFLGFASPPAAPDGPPVASSDGIVLLRVGRQSSSIPSARVEWVQMKSSPHVVLIGFGIGLAVDLTIIYIVGRGLSGLSALGD